mmetsp:Transcript_26947/g.51063  ORF Transcript_26947/g.51063 Transcript_26947/m.51063 type:complete len:280 (-) Transcript_26947:726-1565(-)
MCVIAAGEHEARRRTENLVTLVEFIQSNGRLKTLATVAGAAAVTSEPFANPHYRSVRSLAHGAIFDTSLHPPNLLVCSATVAASADHNTLASVFCYCSLVVRHRCAVADSLLLASQRSCILVGGDLDGVVVRDNVGAISSGTRYAAVLLRVLVPHEVLGATRVLVVVLDYERAVEVAVDVRVVSCRAISIQRGLSASVGRVSIHSLVVCGRAAALLQGRGKRRRDFLGLRQSNVDDPQTYARGEGKPERLRLYLQVHVGARNVQGQVIELRDGEVKRLR